MQLDYLYSAEFIQQFIMHVVLVQVGEQRLHSYGEQLMKKPLCYFTNFVMHLVLLKLKLELMLRLHS